MLLKAKKSLGQNFLIDKNIVKEIVGLGNIDSKSQVIEIGSGTGNLTREILSKNPKELVLIEKDRMLFDKLKSIFSDKAKIINSDFLKLKDHINLNNSIIFGNLPYNVSTQILTKLISLYQNNNKFLKLILMFQKEVADRIVAKPNTINYGRLSIISQWKLDIEKFKDVNSYCFRPIPKVKSTILVFKPKNNFFKIKKVKNLEHVTNIFFSLRRKMIKKPLGILFNNYSLVSDKLNLNINDRPQKLSPLKFYEICKEYEKLID